jgi:endoglucanase
MALVLALVTALVAVLAAVLTLSEGTDEARAASAAGTPRPSTTAAPPRARAATARARVRRAAAVRRRAQLRAVRRYRAAARTSNPFAGVPLYVEPASPAAEQARAWRGTRPADAALMDHLASQPTALWVGDFTPDVEAAAAAQVAAARAQGALPVLVAYDIPRRDCGLHSAGGARDAAAYRRFVGALAAGIGGAPAVVILEPDALAGMDCLPPREQGERVRLIAEAASRLAALPGTSVYIDAGNSAWVGAAEIARRLRAAGVRRATGFALNVSNFRRTPESRAYGLALSRRLGGAPFVIDTSRNGRGPAPGGAWCNPPGRGLGERPTAATGDPLVHAFLWVKRPGESDGTCGGSPPAGVWWPEYALGLVQRAG